MRLRLDRRKTPLSTIFVITDEEGVLRALDFSDYEARMLALLDRHYRTYDLQTGAAPAATTRAIDAYFDGDLAAIEQLETATAGSPFQRDVWKALRDIPAGATTSYGALAERLGRPGASRAVGLANGSNPIAIVVPCHRVIGANGSLTGYGGGLSRKRWLLDHEQRATCLKLSSENQNRSPRALA
jgi:methylated-DNA-[protein]-cysteine S-methyltransferase